MYTKKPDWWKPEMYDDETVKEACEYVINTCGACGTPEQKCSLDVKVGNGACTMCMADLVLELYRRLKNEKNKIHIILGERTE